jgi:hypothetical protein
MSKAILRIAAVELVVPLHVLPTAAASPQINRVQGAQATGRPKRPTTSVGVEGERSLKEATEGHAYPGQQVPGLEDEGGDPSREEVPGVEYGQEICLSRNGSCQQWDVFRMGLASDFDMKAGCGGLLDWDRASLTEAGGGYSHWLDFRNTSQ